MFSSPVCQDVYKRQALGSMTSGLLTGAEANKITKEPFVIYLSGVDTVSYTHLSS